MKSGFKLQSYLIGCIPALFLMGCNTQKQIIPTKETIRNVNREVSFTGKVLELNAAEGGGMAILENISFKNGTVRLAIKGENNPGKSFVGIAFNIQNDSTYEAIYFRPFNFESTEKIRREHGIQYVFEPNYSWKTLRRENKGEFEAEFIKPPSPDDWFTVSLTIEKDKIIVRDGHTGKLLMQAKRLSTTLSDKFGFWVGNNSKGSFKDLTIQ
ncbi:hypothetical protein [Sinomicrobium sp. M5D2P17]